MRRKRRKPRTVERKSTEPTLALSTFDARSTSIKPTSSTRNAVASKFDEET
jgi:hypothetical protein